MALQFQGSMVSLYYRDMALWFQGIVVCIVLQFMVLWIRRSIVSMYGLMALVSNVLWFHGISFTALWLHGIIRSSYCDFIALQFHGIMVSWQNSFKVLWFHCIIDSLYCVSIVLWLHSIMVLVGGGVVGILIPQCCCSNGFMISWYFSFIVLQFYGTFLYCCFMV